MSQTLCKGNNFPLFPVPCSPYLRRYIFHGSESFSWTSAFTALPKCCVGSPAPAWLPSPSVLTFNRLPRPALDLDIWNKKTRCIKPRTQLWTLPVRVPSGLSQAKLRLQRLREKTRSLQRLPQLAKPSNPRSSASSTQLPQSVVEGGKCYSSGEKFWLHLSSWKILTNFNKEMMTLSLLNGHFLHILGLKELPV